MIGFDQIRKNSKACACFCCPLTSKGSEKKAIDLDLTKIKHSDKMPLFARGWSSRVSGLTDHCPVKFFTCCGAEYVLSSITTYDNIQVHNFINIFLGGKDGTVVKQYESR